jgi:heme-degrading monooxygenase HmoA
MFTHTVLFSISPKEIPLYRKDCRMWARFASQAKGFRSYFTVERVDSRNQYASVYVWDNKACHDRFMKKWHDILVGKSRAKVKVLGYYNLKAIDKVSL